jgi:hypothetical protein
MGGAAPHAMQLQSSTRGWLVGIRRLINYKTMLVSGVLPRRGEKDSSSDYLSFLQQ